MKRRLAVGQSETILRQTNRRLTPAFSNCPPRALETSSRSPSAFLIYIGHSGCLSSVRLMFKHLPDFLCALSQPFLKPTNQFVVLAFRVCEIVIRQLGVLLFEFTLDLIPRSSELKFIHTNYSAAPGSPVLSLRHLFWPRDLQREPPGFKLKSALPRPWKP